MKSSINISLVPDIVSFRRLEQNISNEIIVRLRKIDKVVQRELEEIIRTQVFRFLSDSDETKKILSPINIYNIGLPDLEARLIGIYSHIAETTSVKVSVSKNPLLLIEVGIIDSDYSALLSLKEATQPYYNGSWLEWLLTAGTTPVIMGYDYFGNRQGGRAGGGLMGKAQSWSVPDDIAGVQGDNFLTRAIEPIEDLLAILVTKTIESVL